MTNKQTQSAYARAGVDIDAADEAVRRMKAHVATTRTPGVLSDIGAFGGLFALSAMGKWDDPVLVSSIDSVGTKVLIATATGRHDTIGRDLVSHCVNDILVQGARPLFFLDYLGLGKVEPCVASDIVKGLADGCRAAGCALIGGETAELPGLYKPDEYDVAGCIVGIVERAKIVDGRGVKPGDVLLGLASDGLHTNGYSLARKVLLDDAQMTLSAPISELGGVTLADALLWPHRCYAPSVLPILDLSNAVKAMAHITGGGLTDNIPRVLPPGGGVEIAVNSWPVPPLFCLIQARGTIADTEMRRVFNLGIGFVLIVAPEDAEDVARRLTDAGERVFRIGTATAGEGVRYV